MATSRHKRDDGDCTFRVEYGRFARKDGVSGGRTMVVAARRVEKTKTSLTTSAPAMMGFRRGHDGRLLSSECSGGRT